jgi:type II secretory pathway predicted ATPase ExeA
MSRQAKPYRLPNRPIGLKRRLADAGISHAKIAEKVTNEGCKCSRTLLNLLINKGDLPKRGTAGFKKALEKVLADMGVSASAIWEYEPEDRQPPKRLQPKKGHKYYFEEEKKEEAKQPMNYTKVYLESDHLIHFGLEDDPFFDFDDHTEIWMSPQLKAIERHAYRTVKGRGILAVTGDFGSGKSTLLRHLLVKLQADPFVRLIMPDRLDRERMTGSMFTNDIIRTLGGTKMPTSSEERDRLAKQLLEKNMKSGVYSVLVIDEAHDLKEKIFIALKRLWDSGAIFKLIAIILVGAGGGEGGKVWGLRGMIEHNPYLKEFSERCYLVDLGKLNGSIIDYLDYRFRKVGRPVREIFTDGALSLLAQKAQTPQLANNVAVRAMQIAYRDGKSQVHFDHMNDV